MKLRARYIHLIESVSDKVLGYFINVVATIVIYNWILGQNIALTTNLIAGVGFFFVAVARGYLVRRWFNGMIKKLYK